MDLMMSVQLAKPWATKTKMMMNMVKRAVDEVTGHHARPESHEIAGLQFVREQVPNQPQKASGHEPRHSDQHLRMLVMHAMSGVRQCFAPMINPSMKNVFEKSPIEDADKVGKDQPCRRGV